MKIIIYLCSQLGLYKYTCATHKTIKNVRSASAQIKFSATKELYSAF